MKAMGQEQSVSKTDNIKKYIGGGSNRYKKMGKSKQTIIKSYKSPYSYTSIKEERKAE